MSLVLRVAALVAMMVTLAASAFAGARPSPVAGLPYRHSDFDFKVAWKTSLSGQGVAIEGVLKNVRYPGTAGVDVTVYLLDRDHRLLAREMTFPIPQPIKWGETRPFAVTLNQAALAQGDLLLFLIRYQGEDGNDGGTSWMSNFTVDAATGAVVEENREPTDW
jgi:hypothetical protein